MHRHAAKARRSEPHVVTYSAMLLAVALTKVPLFRRLL